jgi:hypothetical protein
VIGRCILSVRGRNKKEGAKPPLKTTSPPLLKIDTKGELKRGFASLTK